MQFSTPDRGPPSEGSPQPRQRNQRPSRRQSLPPPHGRFDRVARTHSGALRDHNPCDCDAPASDAANRAPTYSCARTGGDTPASRAGGSARHHRRSPTAPPARQPTPARACASPSAGETPTSARPAPRRSRTLFSPRPAAAIPVSTWWGPPPARREDPSSGSTSFAVARSGGAQRTDRGRRDSSRIYVRALGAAGGAEAPDRVDLAVIGGNAPAAETGAKSQPP